MVEVTPVTTDAQPGHRTHAGFYTSRPASKGYIRFATSYLQAARQLDFLSRFLRGRGAPGDSGPSTDTLEEAVALTQHHDAITGTEKQHVAADYHMRLSRGPLPPSLLSKGSLQGCARAHFWRQKRLLPP